MAHQPSARTREGRAASQEGLAGAGPDAGLKKTDTIAAVATAPGRAAIGIVRLSGSKVPELIIDLLGVPLAARSATVTSFCDGLGRTIDHGLSIYFPTPHSYTGEDVLELQGHGGPVVLRLLLDRCLELGARLAEPGEFTLRAYLNGRIDLTQAESVIDLIDATTAHAARSAIRSLSGEFSRRIQTLVASITEFRALTEATLDFPDEEVDFLSPASACARLSDLQAGIDSVLNAASQGRILRDGIHVVLAGRPNVGKSSLLNSLSGDDVAIVTSIPGTTRDTIRETISVEGVPLHIVDTAGLRDSADPVEQAGIKRARAAIERADILVQVVDSQEGLVAGDLTIAAALPSGIPRIRVMNKIDLIGRGPAREEVDGHIVIWLSAKSGAGIEELRAALLEAVGWHSNPEGVFSARERHLRALRRARAHVDAAIRAAPALELMAEELRLAQRALSSITGEFSADDLLGEIFARFCIGK